MSEMNHCIYCHLRLRGQRRYNLEADNIRQVISQWTDTPIKPSDLVCHVCWTHANADVPVPPDRKNCICCGKSLFRARTHPLGQQNEQNTRIYNQIQILISPRNIRDADAICHPCWRRADSKASPPEPEMLLNGEQVEELTIEPIEQIEYTICLPRYFQTPNTQQYCFVKGCKGIERHRISKYLKRKLLRDFKCYVLKNSRVCTAHLHTQDWSFLDDIDNKNHYFNAEQIEEMLALVGSVD